MKEFEGCNIGSDLWGPKRLGSLPRVDHRQRVPNRFDAKAPRSRQFGNEKMLFVFDTGAAGVVLRRNVGAGGGIPGAEL